MQIVDIVHKNGYYHKINKTVISQNIKLVVWYSLLCLVTSLTQFKIGLNFESLRFDTLSFAKKSKKQILLFTSITYIGLLLCKVIFSSILYTSLNDYFSDFSMLMIYSKFYLTQVYRISIVSLISNLQKLVSNQEGLFVLDCVQHKNITETRYN